MKNFNKIEIILYLSNLFDLTHGLGEIDILVLPNSCAVEKV